MAAEEATFCELEGIELDEAVARALGVEPGADYSTSWHHGGPLIKRFNISVSPPQARVHRNGGPRAGWGESGFFTCSSWTLRKPDGKRAIAYHETCPLVAAMRLIVTCNPARG